MKSSAWAGGTNRKEDVTKRHLTRRSEGNAEQSKTGSLAPEGAMDLQLTQREVKRALSERVPTAWKSIGSFTATNLIDDGRVSVLKILHVGTESVSMFGKSVTIFVNGKYREKSSMNRAVMTGLMRSISEAVLHRDEVRMKRTMSSSDEKCRTTIMRYTGSRRVVVRRDDQNAM